MCGGVQRKKEAEEKKEEERGWEWKSSYCLPADTLKK